MSYKELKFGIEAREKILSGMKKVYDAVSSTLGPKGSNVAIGRDWGSPLIIHDGVNSARECVPLKDKFENIGAELIKGSADKMDSVGDGTTLATILTYAIASEAHKNIVAGANPMMLRKGIEIAVRDISDLINEAAIQVTTDDQIKQVATISAQDNEIGELVATAIKKLGKDAIITVEESGSTEMSIDYKEGMAFDKGYSSHHFINKPETQECVLENPLILITDQTITQMPEFVSFLKIFSESQGESPNTALVIISGGVRDVPLANLVANKLQGYLQPLAINAPGFGDKQKDFLEDIAIATGGQLVSSELGRKLGEFKIEYLGQAKKVIATKDSTTIIGGGGNTKELANRIKLIKGNIKLASGYDREKLQERLAKLTSGIAVINVGAGSDAEMREKKERCIDAISAIRAALDEGIVAGGETTLMDASQDVSFDYGQDEDIITGIKIVLKSCEAPFSKLMENSGYNAGQMLERYENKDGGIDVMDGKMKDMFEAGIIDPAKVVKMALKYASSTAIMVATTSTLIIENNETDTK